VIQGILTGLGFLGAGAILRAKDGMEVHGLTTAATVWIAAALGVTAGLGAWFMTFAGTLMTLFLLTFGKPVEEWLTRLFIGRDKSAKDDD
jgi:putative Mg2+ transporter-C (MgtC) family protein